MKALDYLSKMGILLIGIALIILASIAVHAYITFLQHSQRTTPFTAYCAYNAVVIHAYQELRDVKVVDNRSSILCSFDRIPEDSEELCMVGGEGVYVVQVGERKDVVECGAIPSRPVAAPD